jgi:hypothetical protein
LRQRKPVTPEAAIHHRRGCLLCDTVGCVGFFRLFVPKPERLEGFAPELRIRADGLRQYELRMPRSSLSSIYCRAIAILAEERYQIRLPCTDATDLGGKVDHEVGTAVVLERCHICFAREVMILAARGKDLSGPDGDDAKFVALECSLSTSCRVSLTLG